MPGSMSHPAAVVGEDNVFTLADSSRNAQFRIVALDREWTNTDLQLDSKLSLLDQRNGGCTCGIGAMEIRHPGYGTTGGHDGFVALESTRSPYALCINGALFLAFKEGIVSYMRTWTTKEYWDGCLASPNLLSPFARNRNSDRNYLAQYVQYVERGLLNPHHVIGEPYTPNVSEFAKGQYKRTVPVYMYIDLYPTAEPPYRCYSIIRAQRPDC
ncbi:hypothetical protein LXA43DRAFT_1105410 [Ganoderma leucocontextum]|nr:hypothetical protein LXA43DRAFT_1105410 [Ganoderma leucocontextum]